MNQVTSVFYQTDIKTFFYTCNKNDIQFQNFLWELNELDNQLNTYLHLEETAQKFVKKLFYTKSNKFKDKVLIRIPNYITNMFIYDFWAYHLFNGQSIVEFQFENPFEEIKSIIIDKSAIKNVELLTLYLNRPKQLKSAYFSTTGVI